MADEAKDAARNLRTGSPAIVATFAVVLLGAAWWRGALDAGIGLFLLNTTVWMLIRARFEGGTPLPVAQTRREGREALLVRVVWVGMFLLPILAIATPLLDFAAYSLPIVSIVLGLLLAPLGIWLFWRSHADLGRNWSPILQLRKGHKLVAHGVYARIRHPMYLALFVITAVQAAFLGNWIAGPAGFLTFLFLFLDRIQPEEAMMADKFGAKWQAYTERSWALFPKIYKLSKAPKSKPGNRILTVKEARHLTPHMIRVTFEGDGLADLPEGREGSNCKIQIPEPGESRDDFKRRLRTGPTPTRRTYTVRHYRKEAKELDIDFVDHGDTGPASNWAREARPGSFLGFAGPGQTKLQSHYADFYLIAADMSALPLASATLEAMPEDAKGLALFEVTSEADIQEIKAPAGIEMRWMIHSEPQVHSTALIDEIKGLDWPSGRVQTCIAGEHSAIKALRAYLVGEKGLKKADAYISGYWKIGLVEDEHQALKRTEAG